MSRAPAFFLRIVDATGAPVSGGKLYTYEAGTTTNKTTYSDYGKTTPNTNPIVAGADGLIGPVYMTDGEGYKFVEKDAGDVELRSEDNIFSSQLTSAELITRVKQIAACPLDYGAEGDGITDDTDAIQDAIDASTGAVDLVGKTYLVDNKITLKSGISLINGTLDFSNCSDAKFIEIEGTISKSPTNITAGINHGSLLVYVASGTGLAVGDLGCVSDTQNYTDDLDRGELGVIESIGGTTVLTLSTPILDQYALGSSPKFTKITDISDVVLRDLEIIGAEGVGGTPTMVSIIGGRRIKIENVKFSAIDTYAVRGAAAWDVQITGCTFHGGNCGVFIEEASQNCRIQNCIFEDLTDPIIIGGGDGTWTDVNGPPRFIFVENNEFLFSQTTTDAAIFVDDEAQHIFVQDNRFVLGGGATRSAIQCDCVDATIRNNFITGVGTGVTLVNGITLKPKVPDRSSREYRLIVEGNQIIVDGTAIIYESQDNTGATDHLIDMICINNNRGQGDTADITITKGAETAMPDITSIDISDNKFTGGGVTIGHADDDNSVLVTNLKICRNQFESLTLPDQTGTDSLQGPILVLDNHIVGNTLFDGMSTAAEMVLSGGYYGGSLTITDCEIVHVSNCVVQGALKLVNPDESHISGVTARYDSGAGIEVDLDTDITNKFSIVGCHCEPGYIHVHGRSDSGLISGCLVESAADGILVVGDAANYMGGVNIVGNSIFGAADGIDLTNAVKTSCAIFGNRCTSCTDDVVTSGFQNNVRLDEKTQLLTKTVTLTAAQIRALKATPQQILAGKSGCFYQVVGGYMQLNSNGTAFTQVDPADDLEIYYNGTSDEVTDGIDGAVALASIVDLVTFLTAADLKGLIASNVVNTGIDIKNAGPSEFTNGGDSTLVITLTYIEHEQS